MNIIASLKVPNQLIRYLQGEAMRVSSLDLNTTQGATTAYVDRPEQDTHTAVILIQEWWGINQHIRDLASRYADEGYNCVAPDLYRGRVAQNAEEASTMMHALAIEDGMETIRKAIQAARATFGFDQFVITGYCMGGTFALRAACEIPELKAAAPFYGDIPEDNVLKHLSVPTLFIAGERDNWITPAKVDGLRKAAARFGLPVETVSYDADHAFFNDTRPEVYNEGAATDAWRRVLEFFKRYTVQERPLERPATFP
ncbi:MAG TPA: dienelactone hydrolase family protein [Pyrinomonadaceae bacterium]|nr:dienelactone hydrolase family protein [Pyrinomonadaceae bacterium]